NDTQYFARSSLLLQRFFELLEQTDVLKCDHGLVRECFKELDLYWSERAQFSTTRGQGANKLIPLSKGSGQKGAEIPAATHHRKFILRSVDIRNMEGAVFFAPPELQSTR